MKILSVFNPVVTDYKVGGAPLMGAKLGQYINDNSNMYNTVVDYVADESIKEIITKGKVYSPVVKKLGYIKQTIEFAVSIFNEFGYDVMHIHIPQSSSYAAISENIPSEIPVVYTQHNSTILGRFSLNYRPFAKDLLINRNNFRVVCPSNIMVDIVREFSGTDSKNIVMIRNGVDEVSYQDIGSTERYMTCSRIDPNKGVLEMAKFCDYYNIPIDMYCNSSSGSKKALGSKADNYYDNFIDLCNNSNNINLIDKPFDNDNLRNIMRKYKGFIFFSNKESSGLVIIEALHAGLPIFYKEEDAIKEILDDSCSVMINRSDLYRKREDKRLEIYKDAFDNFEKAIDKLKTNTKKVFDMNNLSMKSCADSYYSLYSELLRS